MLFDLECPDGWVRARLSDLGEVNRGRSRHRPRHAPHLYGGPYPFLQTGDIKASGGRIKLHEQTYSEAGLAQSRLWPAGTMCITIAANIAETGILTFDACFPDSVIGFIADDSRCDVRFIEYVFRNLRKRIQHVAASSGTVQDNINLGLLDDLRLPIPPTVQEQRAIAGVLGALDDKIEANRALNETLEATCQALFRSWFIDFDPVVAKSEGRRPAHLTAEVAALFPDRFEDSQIGPVPAGWAVEPLDSIADFENGLALQKHRPAPGEEQLPVIKIAQLRDGAPGTEEWASANIKTSCILDDGDVVFSWSGSLMVTIWCGGRGALNQHLFKVTSDRFPKWFYHQWTMHHLPEFQGIAADKATTMGHIRRHHLTEAACVVAPPEVIAAADRLLGPSLESFVAAALESRTLATLRDALLPRLLSGELRVRQAEQLVEEAI